MSPLPGGYIAPAHLAPLTAGHPWQFIEAQSTIHAVLGAATTANKPTNIQANDLLHISLFSSPDIAPAGWTKLQSNNIETFWRVATADANDDFNLPVGTDPETGRIVIYSVFRRPGEVPDQVGFGPYRQVINGGMIIGETTIDQSSIIEPILISTSVRSGIDPQQAPIYDTTSSPWRAVMDPVYAQWGGTEDRFAYLGTAYILEETGSIKARGSYNFTQFEGASSATDTRSFRFDIV